MGQNRGQGNDTPLPLWHVFFRGVGGGNRVRTAGLCNDSGSLTLLMTEAGPCFTDRPSLRAARLNLNLSSVTAAAASSSMQLESAVSELQHAHTRTRARVRTHTHKDTQERENTETTLLCCSNSSCHNCHCLLSHSVEK